MTRYPRLDAFARNPMMRIGSSLTAALLFAAVVSAQTSFFPLRDVKAGMHGIGRTVFSGDRIEEFDVEILGVLENIGPKQSLILGRLSGGPLAKTGVMQGMSGSPVFIDGKLAGAVAMAFPFATEPIAGIRPIEDMVRVAHAGAEPVRRAAVNLTDTDLTRMFPAPAQVSGGAAKMIDIATPVYFGGFTQATVEQFAPQLRSLGLEPRQGVTGGGRVDPRMGDASRIKPGSMISVQLMTGDMSIGADGTVTWVDGNKLYAFGHRFLSIGATAMPFARAEVLTLLPSLNSSFKVSSARELMGMIQQDRNTAVAGELGTRADLVPISIAMTRAGRKLDSYKMQMVADGLLSPLLVQMAVFSSIDATERTVGASSFRIKGEIQFQGSAAPVRLDNMFAADNGSAIQASISTAVPLAYVLQSGFDKLKLKQVDVAIESYDVKKQLQIDRVLASRRVARPGDTIEINTVLAGDNGAETSRTVRYQVPVGASPGTLYFTVADGATTNLTEFRQFLNNVPKSPDQLVSVVNSLRANTSAYVRVWRADPAYQLEGGDFPDPPPSVAMILAGSPPVLGGVAQVRNSKVAELEISGGDTVISGSKTIQVEIKE
jgi:SpoIVB peptidase S55